MPIALQHSRATLLGMFGHPARYDQLTHRAFGALFTRITADVAGLELPPTARVLDIGTGPGRLPVAIARAVPGVGIDGIDLSAAMIAHARRSVLGAGLANRIALTVGDVAEMPYPDSVFDLVISSMSQHHWPDAAAGVREVRRVLRPAGAAWIYDATFGLGRAEAAAREVFPAGSVHREALRINRFPMPLFGRVAVHQRPGRDCAEGA